MTVAQCLLSILILIVETFTKRLIIVSVNLTLAL